MVNGFHLKNFLNRRFIYSKCLNADAILSETDSFEEYPLIFRDSQIKSWRNHFQDAEIFDLWISFAVFLLNFYRISRLNGAHSDIFLCITVDRFEDAKSGGIPVPSIFASTCLNVDDFLNKLKSKTPAEDSEEMTIVKSAFLKISASDFVFYESRFFDENSRSDILRIYCV